MVPRFMRREPSGFMRWLVVRVLSRSVVRAVGPLAAGASSDVANERGLAAFRNLTLVAALAAAQQQDGGAACVRALFDEAFRLGSRVRRAMRIKDDHEAFSALRYFYRCISIDIEREESLAGEWMGLRFRACYFARTYTPATCAFMASFDSGFTCGLTNGRGLAFSARLTEGASCCCAALTSVSNVLD